jgi:hypothetical protein
MRAMESMVAWNPGTKEVEVGPWPDYERWSDKYRCTSGACYALRHGKNEQFQKMMVFIDAIHMIVRDRVDPMAVHLAMINIDEYADGCSDDMPRISKLMEGLY